MTSKQATEIWFEMKELTQTQSQSNACLTANDVKANMFMNRIDQATHLAGNKYQQNINSYNYMSASMPYQMGQGIQYQGNGMMNQPLLGSVHGGDPSMSYMQHQYHANVRSQNKMRGKLFHLKNQLYGQGLHSSPHCNKIERAHV